MRNPLSSLLGSVALLYNSKNLAPEHVRIVRRAHSSGEILLSQVNNVLDSAKIQTNELRVNLQPTNIRKELWKVAEANLTVIEQKRNDFEYNVDPRVPK